MNIPPQPNRPAFGETLGLPVPTRYPVETHNFWDTVLAMDLATTPTLTNLSPWVRRICYGLSALLLISRLPKSTGDQRVQLQAETALGIAVLGVALFWKMGFFERLHLISIGILILGNALMTQVQ